VSATPTNERREFLISKGWIQAVVLVVPFGFFVLGLLAYRTYQAHPHVPKRVVDPTRTKVGRSCARSTPGRTRKPGASTV
jgi:hypothetical protein